MAEVDYSIHLENDGSGNYAPIAIRSAATLPAGGTRLPIPYVQNPTETEAAKTIASATTATPIVATSTAHGYSNGDLVHIQAIPGMTPTLNITGTYEVANVAANTFELKNSVGSGTYVASSAKVQRIAKAKNIFDALEIAVRAIQADKAAGA